MPEINKPLLRLAVAIRAELARHRLRNQAIQMPASSWDGCVKLVRQIHRAELRGWHLAAETLRRDLGYTIPTLQAELAAIVTHLPRATGPTPPMAKLSDVLEDLLALQLDFEEFDFDVRGRWMSVTTEPITLNAIYLGPFEIRLDWGRAGSDSAYRVIATDPHPPQSRDNVTHPHVMDEKLCEGHGRQAIRQALAQGRLLDFFTLVAGGLRTYNEESPFVALEIWYGSTCSDCGAVMDDDEGYVCEKCEATICSGCECACSGCGVSCCSECITGCEACDDNYCRSCLRSCRQCQAHVCSTCLQDNERCVTCHEKETSAAATPDSAALQPHGLGQAPVPA
jgi:hypothetical protein